jgi:integrase
VKLWKKEKIMNNKILEFNNLEKDYLRWCKEYFAYKVLTFDRESVSDDFDAVELEEKIRADKINNLDELHEVVRETANKGLGQLANISIGIKKFFDYIKKDIKSFDKIDDVTINSFLNKKCIDFKLSYGTRSNYKNGLVGLFTFIMDETKSKFPNLVLENVKVEESFESRRDTSKLIDWMDLKMISKANKELLKYPFETEFEKCRDILIFRLFCFSGIEPKELINLKEENFIFENGEMVIKIFETPTRRERSIDLPKAFLIRYFNKYKELKENKTDLFFYHHKNSSKSLDNDFVTNIVKKILDFANIKLRDKTPRMLRKSLAINLNNEKNPETGLTMPEKNIQEILGIKNSTEFASMLKLNSVDVMTASRHFLNLKLN